MPRVLIAALAASLILHAVALFLLNVDLTQPPERPPLLAKLLIPPKPQPVRPAVEEKISETAKPDQSQQQKEPPKARIPSIAHSNALVVPAANVASPVEQASAPKPEAVQPEPVAAPVEPRLPVRGAIRYKVIMGTQNFEAGRAESVWEFADGNYRFKLLVETTGLAWMVRSVSIESESRGKLVAGGLQPERFSYVKRSKGKETTEIAEFDWAKREVALGAGGSRHPISEGVQDLLSIQYQLIYVPNLIEGATIGIVTHRKFETHRLHIVGEEEVEAPNGNFRTLHVMVQTEKRKTELWLARDHGLLPVKVRHIDPNDTYEMIVTEIGTPQQ